MARKRKAYAPFSLSSEAGISAAPGRGFIQVDQEIRPTVDTGFIDNRVYGKDTQQVIPSLVFIIKVMRSLTAKLT